MEVSVHAEPWLLSKCCCVALVFWIVFWFEARATKTTKPGVSCSWHRPLSNLASPAMHGTQHTLAPVCLRLNSCNSDMSGSLQNWSQFSISFFVLIMFFYCHSTAHPPGMWFLWGILSVWRSGAFGQEVQPQSRGDQRLGTKFEMDIPDLNFTFNTSLSPPRVTRQSRVDAITRTDQGQMKVTHLVDGFGGLWVIIRCSQHRDEMIRLTCTGLYLIPDRNASRTLGARMLTVLPPSLNEEQWSPPRWGVADNFLRGLAGVMCSMACTASS